MIAPHPFYPTSSCLRRHLGRHHTLFDAVELNAFYTPTLDFNRAAVRWAKAHGKPVVGNGDVHRLGQLDTTYSLVDAAPHPDAICEAIRAGRVEVKTRPISLAQAAAHLTRLVAGDLSKPFRRRPAATPFQHPSLGTAGVRDVS